MGPNFCNAEGQGSAEEIEVGGSSCKACQQRSGFWDQRR